MENTLSETIDTLKALSIGQLQMQYRQLFGEEHPTRHRDILVRRIAWRLQTLAEGGLSERARERAQELASDADIRVLIPRRALEETRPRGHSSGRDHRLPPAGAVLRRQYGDRTVEVTVLEDGFEHEGVRYGSLSAIATKVTGTRWNGFLFFAMGRRTRGKRGRS
jgi:hypothetical protein